MLPYMALFIGPWICSLRDSDRLALSAAHQSFNYVFPSEDKRLNAIKLFQDDIIGYIRNVMLYEAPDTISDARFISADDMISRYTRLIASLLSTLTLLLESKYSINLSIVSPITNAKEFWAFSSSETTVKKSFLLCISQICKVAPELIIEQENLVVNSFVSKVLRAGNLKSVDLNAAAVIYTLNSLSPLIPKLWDTTDSKGKRLTLRLLAYIQSQKNLGSEIFWNNLFNLMKNIPMQELFINPDYRSAFPFFSESKCLHFTGFQIHVLCYVSENSFLEPSNLCHGYWALLLHNYLKDGFAEQLMAQTENEGLSSHVVKSIRTLYHRDADSILKMWRDETDTLLAEFDASFFPSDLPFESVTRLVFITGKLSDASDESFRSLLFSPVQHILTRFFRARGGTTLI